MRRIIVTPAGRQRYLELLLRHLAAQRGSFDEWHLWRNTQVPEDIQYMQGLADKHDWIRVVTHPDSRPGDGNFNIHRFFQYAADPECVYLRLDDDIVWLEPGFVETMFAFRVANPQYFLTFGNIINNAVIAHVHERMGKVWSSQGRVSYQCMCPVGWNNGPFAQDLHDAFLAAIDAGTYGAWHFDLWKLYHYERVSINAVAWLGSEFEAFGGAVGADEEAWLTTTKPVDLQKMNAVCGNALCVHYAFHTQRPHLETTDVLARYDAVAPRNAPAPRGKRVGKKATKADKETR